MRVLGNSEVDVAGRTVPVADLAETLLRSLDKEKPILHPVQERNRNLHAIEVRKIDILPVLIHDLALADHERDLFKRAEVRNAEHFVKGIVCGGIQLVMLEHFAIHHKDASADRVVAPLLRRSELQNRIAELILPAVGVEVRGHGVDAEHGEEAAHIQPGFHFVRGGRNRIEGERRANRRPDALQPRHRRHQKRH